MTLQLLQNRNRQCFHHVIATVLNGSYFRNPAKNIKNTQDHWRTAANESRLDTTKVRKDGRLVPSAWRGHCDIKMFSFCPLIRKPHFKFKGSEAASNTWRPIGGRTLRPETQGQILYPGTNDHDQVPGPDPDARFRVPIQVADGCEFDAVSQRGRWESTKLDHRTNPLYQSETGLLVSLIELG